MHPSTLTPIASLLLAQSTSGASVGGNFPSVAYILAMILVAAGLGLIVFVGLAWLRGRDQHDTLSPTEEQLIASYSAPYAPAPAASNEESTISLSSNTQPPVGTTQEAERLLRLMGEAEELCTRLARDLDERADRLERLMARANGMIGEGLSESRMPQPNYNTPRPAPQQQPQPYTIPSAPQQPPQQRPEIITRPIGVPAMAAQIPQPQMMGQPNMAPQPQMYAPAPAPAAPAPTHAHVPAPAPRMPAPPPIPQHQSYAQPMPPPQHQQHQPQYTNGTAASHAPSNNGQAYPAEAEALAQHIFRLADAGLTPAEIAQRLGQHTGKVELIIALRNA